MITAWLKAFVFTQLVEVPIYSVGLRCHPLAAFGASAFTHPIVWLIVLHPAWHAPYVTKVIVAETFAWLAEAAYFDVIFKKRRAWLWALLANAASFGMGLLSRWLFGAP
ncbi:MAG: hypothetical protein HY897_05145 [Deltaproteobacteria bacterium]|nr:hypothetical protein [Deltaproteobacteria bacterium]